MWPSTGCPNLACHLSLSLPDGSGWRKDRGVKSSPSLCLNFPIVTDIPRTYVVYFSSDCCHHYSSILMLNFEVIHHIDCIPIPPSKWNCPIWNPVKGAASCRLNALLILAITDWTWKDAFLNEGISFLRTETLLFICSSLAASTTYSSYLILILTYHYLSLYILTRYFSLTSLLWKDNFIFR